MKATDREHLTKVQYGTLEGLNKRWKAYEYLHPQFDIYQEAIEGLSLTGSEDILEVGCGDGKNLLAIDSLGHQGNLVGLDLHEGLFPKNRQHVQFMSGTAEALPFPDESFDVVIGFFMIYHMPDPEAAVREWNRVLKKGGRLVLTASTSKNKPKIKALKREAVLEMGKVATGITDNCPFEKAVEVVQSIMSELEVHIFASELRIPLASVVVDDIDSTRDMISPAPSDQEWEAARNFIERKTQEEIIKEGFFRDSVERGLLIATKTG